MQSTVSREMIEAGYRALETFKVVTPEISSGISVAIIYRAMEAARLPLTSADR